MAFLKYAKANVTRPHLQGGEWDSVRVASGKPRFDRSLVHQASDILGGAFTPQNYLLTHATIIASVDVEDVPNVRLGSVTEDGSSIHRKFPDYRIKAGCDKYINNNLDCWSRSTLMKSYRTFVGAHNFCEHIQIEDLSKGRIIDAVPRDVGDSVYVDILVATNRKNASLIRDIESGRMNSMSMGCSVDFTICTKCGHVAADETQMCSCVRYEKGNVFYDESGNQHRVAELCGHHSIDPTGGVTFIEASWVAVPAFTGAVARNIISLGDLSEKPASVSQGVLTVPSFEIPLNRLKSASKFAIFDDEDGEEDAGDEDGEPSGEESKTSPLDNLKVELEGVILDKVLDDLKDLISEEEDSGESSISLNETVIKEGSVESYKAKVRYLAASSMSSSDFIFRLASFNSHSGVQIESPLYRAALKLGSLNRYKSPMDFKLACIRALGRKPDKGDFTTLAHIAKLVSLIKENENA